MWLKIINGHYHINSCNPPCPCTDASPSRPQRTQPQLCGCGLCCPRSSEPPGQPRPRRTSRPPQFTVFPHLRRCQVAQSLLDRNLGASEPQDPRDSLGPSACCSVLTYWCHQEAHGKPLLSTVKLWHLHIACLLKSKFEQGKVLSRGGANGSPHPPCMLTFKAWDNSYMNLYFQLLMENLGLCSPAPVLDGSWEALSFQQEAGLSLRDTESLSGHTTSPAEVLLAPHRHLGYDLWPTGAEADFPGAKTHTILGVCFKKNKTTHTKLNAKWRLIWNEKRNDSKWQFLWQISTVAIRNHQVLTVYTQYAQNLER